MNALVVGGRSRSDPQCALLPCSRRIIACKPKDYCRECRLDSPCLCESAHSHVPGPAGLTQLGESIVSSSSPYFSSQTCQLFLSPSFSHYFPFLWCLMLWSPQDPLLPASNYQVLMKPSEKKLVCVTGAVSTLLKAKQRCEIPKCFYHKSKEYGWFSANSETQTWKVSCVIGFIKEKRGCSRPHSSTQCPRLLSVLDKKAKRMYPSSSRVYFVMNVFFFISEFKISLVIFEI